MPIALILQLLTTFGPPAVTLIDGLITKWQTSGVVTPEEWAAISASLKLSATDHMTSQLKAAGIDLSSPQAVALLALTK
jgi:hypothetical protein